MQENRHRNYDYHKFLFDVEFTIIVNLEHCFPGHFRKGTLFPRTFQKRKKIILFGPDLNPELPGARNDYLPLDH